MLPLARANEAERLALELPQGRERELYVQIAFLWRELAQIALARELRRQAAGPDPEPCG